MKYRVEVTLIDILETGKGYGIQQYGKSNTGKGYGIQQAKELIEFKLDSGANVTFLRESTNHKLQVKPEPQRTNNVLLGPCNYMMECRGKYSTKLSIDERSTEEEIYVIRDLERPLLGRHAAQSPNLLTRVNSMAKGGYKAKVKHKYPKLFIGLGRMKAEYNITLQENPKPYAITVPRQVPLPLFK